MPNTKKLSDSIQWAQFFVGGRPLAINGGLEPATTSANMVIQAMLQPPFKYRWNRSTVSFLTINPSAVWTAVTSLAAGVRLKDSNGNMQTVTTAGTSGGSVPTWNKTINGTTNDGSAVWTTSLITDYVQAVPDWGFVEKAYVVTSAGVSTEINFLASEMTGQDAGIGRPHTLSPYLDDNAGNITFRMMPGIPDQQYTVYVIYQKQPTLMTALSGVWPIPDKYSFIYNQGFLGFCYLLMDDQRSAFMLQRFISDVLALAEGLTEQDRNAFLEQWNVTLQMQRAAMKSSQGTQVRSI